jgi:hypothetical protein
VRIYDLRFASVSELSRAVRRLLDSERVASCTVETDLRRVRFVAPRPQADALVERIYADGGLAWCSRHDGRPAAAPTSRDPVPRA